MEKPIVVRMKGTLNDKKIRINNEEVVYIGRNLNMAGWRLKCSKWCNPYKVGKDGSLEDVLEKYEVYLRNSKDLLDDLHELNGCKLGCWCKPKKCHGDIIVKLFDEKYKTI